LTASGLNVSAWGWTAEMYSQETLLFYVKVAYGVEKVVYDGERNDEVIDLEKVSGALEDTGREMGHVLLEMVNVVGDEAVMVFCVWEKMFWVVNELCKMKGDNSLLVMVWMEARYGLVLGLLVGSFWEEVVLWGIGLWEKEGDSCWLCNHLLCSLACSCRRVLRDGIALFWYGNCWC